MTIKAGDKAKESGQIKCVDCEMTMEIEEGEEIMECDCGSDTFEMETSQSSQQKGKRKSA